MTGNTIKKKLSHILYEYGMLSAENSLLAEDVVNDSFHSILQDDSRDEPVIQFVNQLLNDAVKQHVSDIHIESCAHHCRIRFRRDGLLYDTAELPVQFANRVMTRIKIMSNLDIAEKRMPQDGRMVIKQAQQVDCRVSTCPALHGEKIVMRLLYHQAQQLSLDELGMSAQQMQQFHFALQQPQGLILVTGPTGSGKTATLYSALQLLNTQDKNIMTVEDPVEIAMSGITQVNINNRIGLTFSAILRAFLRQDPDIIMIGEIRDAETANIAVQAAQTGHLVLSTLHTNHAFATLKRLLSLGVEIQQLAGSLLLLAAQRLVRKLCLLCDAQGCQQCHAGYNGRTGIFEILPISAHTSQLFLAKSNLTQIEQQIKSESQFTLSMHGNEKLNNGITNQIELNRILGAAA